MDTSFKVNHGKVRKADGWEILMLELFVYNINSANGKLVVWDSRGIPK